MNRGSMRIRRIVTAAPALALLALVAVSIAPATTSRAVADDDDNGRPRADPFVFVGTAADCGGTAGSNIVTSAWLGGMGLPDDGTTANAPNPNARRDPHRGLLLSKNGPTADCSSAGARIRGVDGMTVTATSALGFDYRNGTHCGAGAPRFNVVVRPPNSNTDTFHFVGGCANSTKTPAPQDPSQWTRVRATLTNPAQAFPPIPVGSRIRSISILYDEGTDSTSVPDDPNGVGLAVVDNIFINGAVITSGNGVAEPGGNNNARRREGDDDDD